MAGNSLTIHYGVDPLKTMNDCSFVENVYKQLHVLSRYCKWIKCFWAKPSRFLWFLEEYESFFHEYFAPSTTYKHPGLAPQKYFQENPYNVNIMKV